MFYVISKLFFAFARPLHFVLLLMIAGLVLQLLRRRIGLWIITLSVIGLLVGSFTPLGYILEAPLENRFPRPDTLNPAPDGIIILGGAMDPFLAVGRADYVALNDAGERLTEIPRLAKLYPNARIIYTGGPPLEGPGLMSEVDAAAKLFTEFGIAPDRITLERKSLTTWENATMTKEIVKPSPDSHWLLVTSAWHMPRSVGTFRAAGWPGIIAYPTDYRVTDPKFGIGMSPSAIENLMLIEVAAKEWYGMLGYWLSGRSSALYPAP